MKNKIRIDYDKNADLVKREYDENDNLIKETYSNRYINEWKYKYDRNGNKIIKKTYLNNTIKNKIKNKINLFICFIKSINAYKHDEKNKMKNKTNIWFAKLIDTFKHNTDYLYEKSILDITEKICVIMENKNIDMYKLAAITHMSLDSIKNILNGNKDTTLYQLIEIINNLDCNIDVNITQKK